MKPHKPLFGLTLTSVAVIVAACGGAAQTELDGAVAERDAHAVRISELEASVGERDEGLTALEAEFADLSEALAEEQDRIEALRSSLDSEKARANSADQAVAEAQEAKAEAQQLVEQLLLTFDEDIVSTTDRIRAMVPVLACTAGTRLANENLSFAARSVRGDVATEVNKAADEDPAIAAVLNLTDSLWSLADPDAADSSAQDCFETRDAELTAQLQASYEPLRQAALIGACTAGTDESATSSYLGSSDADDVESAALASIEADTDLAASYARIAGGLDEIFGDGDYEDILFAEAERCFLYADRTAPKGSGTYKVGEEIAPGTWITDEDGANGHCYWARLTQYNDIRDNDFASNDAPMRIVVRSSDAYIEIDGNCDFLFQG
jgi:Skp family chaperone for outer membrane proteins